MVNEIIYKMKCKRLLSFNIVYLIYIKPYSLGPEHIAAAHVLAKITPDWFNVAIRAVPANADAAQG